MMSSSKWVRLMFGPFGLKPSSVCGVVRGPAGRSSFSWTAVCRQRRSGVSVCSARSASYTTVDPGEVKRFQALANKWWDEQGEFAALHAMNDLRVPFVRDNLLTVHRAHHPGKPLAGLRILDVGCGGGVFTEPLGRLGASVLGIDPVEESISVAQLHSSPDPDLRDRVSYHACTLEQLSDEGEEERQERQEQQERSEAQFDAVVASEVVEHLADLETFAICCNHVLKPGGSLFITTINKTNLSYALAIVIAEQLLRIVPSGTHDWEKFISPVELERLLESNGFSVQSVQGMMYNPVSGAWSWSDSTAINYALHAVKTSDGAEESCTHSVNEPATTHSSAPS
ncbi:ubiquinone biosynthesis O-methyltransferase, mitochondrial [Kryptolebias marmoratus]|uniref:ubiquinone biosynthesis O-methyltransferase, mitochondrial n=1 Tax=Kryptolebias marmoratus TaxID=37003 RepID=UPI0007F8C624|nr:ubiquinone biosynthesis O-methyltransferase, mitochondrial [Kryptolebias marmoratus]